MYTQVRQFIKTAIGFLAAGLLVGLYMIAMRELYGVWPHPYVRSAHVHAVFFGFVVFLILGVALWLFPRAAKDDTRYRPERIAASYWVLTSSTAIRFVGELLRTSMDAEWLRWAVLLAGVGQVLGVGIYFYTMWTRIRPVGSHMREAKGERF
ncbi:MAG: cbb3-type cytochrome c oxidase subunit I [Gemmatimonadota bacterium]